ncbi:MAG: VWA domain-containing protein [Anaerolineales bacterium]|nr:VWA domain-containing protein [Anaerolineales bacterium]
MDERIVKFIAALRSAGVRVSIAESTDAFRAIECLGIKDREVFRISLRASLVKDASDIPVFEELFPIFFSNGQSLPLTNPTEDLTPEEAQKLAQALRQFNDQLRQMLEKLSKGEPLSAPEMERLARMVGLNQMDNMRYREWIVQRMKKALQFAEVQAALKELAETLAQMGIDKEKVNQLIRSMQTNQQGMEDQVRQFAGQRIAENMSERPPQDSLESLLNRSFHALSEKEMELLRKEIQRLANALKTRVALRQKRARSGQLDAKATIRANLKHGNVPIELKHREQTLKPKLVVICDVSTSMRFCSGLMLSLLYHLQDLIQKTHAFAFINRLEYISPDFSGKTAAEAVGLVLERMPAGYYNTDLGSSLDDLDKDFPYTCDSRTTFILVGDGRNNYNDPRISVFNATARRCRRTIWINPEPPTLWGSGDSDMLKYAPSCDVILQASNLAQLISAVDKLLIA